MGKYVAAMIMKINISTLIYLTLSNSLITKNKNIKLAKCDNSFCIIKTKTNKLKQILLNGNFSRA